MKRELKANLDFQITTKLEVKELIPRVEGYAVVVNGHILPFDFNNMPVTVNRDGDKLKFSIEQIKLESGIFTPDFMEKGFIAEAGDISLDIFTGNGDSFHEDEIQITSFVVVDIVTGDKINICCDR